MKISNPLQINDWEIKKFLKVVLAIQLALWGVIGLEAIGLHIPGIRQLLGFVYLSFIPGVIILRILKLHKLGNIETIVYSLGLSIAFIMCLGFLINLLYPLFGISRPISITPLTITISAFVLILCIISYVRDKDFSATSLVDIRGVSSPAVLFLCLVPFLSIFGTYLVNFYHTNILWLFLIPIIVLIVLLIGFNRFIPENLYPLAVFIITISLFFQRSLISMYILGYDIHSEYQVSNLVITNAVWDPTMPGVLNAMLSITMLAPVSSLVSGISLTWVFKIVYPLLFSLAFPGLYRVFQKQTGNKIAFLSCFLFASAARFYLDLPILERQLIAMLFLVSLILLMIDKRTSKIKRSFLFIIFGASLAVSYYTLSYIYIFWLVFAWLILILAESPELRNLKTSLYSKFSRYKSEKLAGNPISLKTGDRTISSTLVLLFVVFALAWYMYVSSSTVFDSFARFGNHIASSFSIDISNLDIPGRTASFLSPGVSEGVQGLLAQLLQRVNTMVYYLNYFFIIMGVFVLSKPIGLKFEKEYVAFSIVNLAIFLAGIIPPFLPPLLLATGLDTGLLSHLALIFLAPFWVIGGLATFRVISRMSKVSWTNESVRKWLMVLSVYFVILFLRQTGFVYEVTQNYPMSTSPGQERVKYGDTEMKFAIYSTVTLEQDVFSARWLSTHRNPTELIYATYEDIRVRALTSYGMIPVSDVLALASTTKEIPKDAYVYLLYLNVVEEIGTDFDISSGRTFYDMTNVSHLFEGKDKIYSNGGSEIYK